MGHCIHGFFYRHWPFSWRHQLYLAVYPIALPTKQMPQIQLCIFFHSEKLYCNLSIGSMAHRSTKWGMDQSVGKAASKFSNRPEWSRAEFRWVSIWGQQRLEWEIIDNCKWYEIGCYSIHVPVELGEELQHEYCFVICMEPKKRANAHSGVSLQLKFVGFGLHFR